MNLTDKARRGSQEAMEALFDMTKNDVAYLCRLLLGDNQAASVAVPRIYRSLWEQVLAGRITTEEDFAQAALVKTAAFCKTVLAKKDSKSFRIPQNRDFVLGMGEGRLSLQGEPRALAKLFHTNEETVRLAQVAEAICLKRLFAALSRLLGREISLTQEEFHRALKANRPRAEVPPTVDSAVLHAIRAVCRPIQRRLAKKRKRVALAAGTVVVLVCLTGGIVYASVAGDGGVAAESTASVSSAVEESSAAETSSETSAASEESSTLSESSTVSQDTSSSETSAVDSEAA